MFPKLPGESEGQVRPSGQLRVKERLEEHPPTPDLSDDDEGRRRTRGGAGANKASSIQRYLRCGNWAMKTRLLVKKMTPDFSSATFSTQIPILILPSRWKTGSISAIFCSDLGLLSDKIWMMWDTKS